MDEKPKLNGKRSLWTITEWFAWLNFRVFQRQESPSSHVIQNSAASPARHSQEGNPFDKTDCFVLKECNPIDKAKVTRFHLFIFW